jgi:hypothetical protein
VFNEKYFLNNIKIRDKCLINSFLATVRPDWPKFRHLGNFLHKQFSPKQAVTTQGVCFKSSLMRMFWAIKLSFDVDISVFWAAFSKHKGKFYSIFWSH